MLVIPHLTDSTVLSPFLSLNCTHKDTQHQSNCY